MSKIGIGNKSYHKKLIKIIFKLLKDLETK